MRKNNKVTRLKLAWFFFRGKVSKHVRIMTCGKCKSIEIIELPESESEQTISTTNRTTYVWRDKVKCLKCGAECEEKQIWKW